MSVLTYFSLVLVLANAFCFEIPKKGVSSRRVTFPVKQQKEREHKEFPYQAGLLLSDSDSESSWCSGSLIANEWILTSAHCIEGIEEATVYLGSSNYQLSKVTHKVKKENFSMHPDWNRRNIENDIALIKIPYTSYSEKIKPVKLASIKETDTTYIENNVITSGWGHVSDSSVGISSELDWSYMNVIKNDLCRSYFGWVIKPSNVCIWTYGLASNCRGDSGGPLVLESSMTQIGVSSFGSNKGCEKGMPTVFTRVSSYLDWIESQTGTNFK